MRYEEHTMMDGTIIQIPIEHDPEDMMSGALDTDDYDCYA